MSFPCPCYSGIPYSLCCEPYHKGKPAPRAELLMRSRYSAYALHLIDYIIKTTHPKNPSHATQQDLWRKEILRFSETTSFDGLHIDSIEEGTTSAYVTFTATLTQSKHDVSFTERSLFEKVDGVWLYTQAS